MDREGEGEGGLDGFRCWRFVVCGVCCGVDWRDWGWGWGGENRIGDGKGVVEKGKKGVERKGARNWMHKFYYGFVGLRVSAPRGVRGALTNEVDFGRNLPALHLILRSRRHFEPNRKSGFLVQSGFFLLFLIFS